MSSLILVFLSFCLSLSFQLECDPRHFSNVSQITIGPTTDGFCVGEGVTESCCSGNWESLVDSTWNSWFGQLEIKFSTITGTLHQAHQYIRGLNCTSSGDSSGNQTLNLYKETLKSIEVLQVDWKTLLFNITSMECRLKLVQTAHCPTCNNLHLGGGTPLRPCRSLCANILRGCLWQLEAIQDPWKHAINSVRTAVRLLASPTTGEECRPKDLEWFTATLNTWREPLVWLDSTCEILPDDTNNCYNGKARGTYKKAVSGWANQKSNPEFMIWSENDDLSSNVLTVKSQLTNLSKTLEEYWPRIDPTSRSVEGMSSDEAEGSGSGNYPTDWETDDEDLLHSEYGSGGSGDGEETVDPIIRDPIKPSTAYPTSPPSPPQISKSPTTAKPASKAGDGGGGSGNKGGSSSAPKQQLPSSTCHLLFLLIVQTLLPSILIHR